MHVEAQWVRGEWIEAEILRLPTRARRNGECDGQYTVRFLDDDSEEQQALADLRPLQVCVMHRMRASWTHVRIVDACAYCGRMCVLWMHVCVLWTHLCPYRLCT